MKHNLLLFFLFFAFPIFLCQVLASPGAELPEELSPNLEPEKQLIKVPGFIIAKKNLVPGGLIEAFLSYEGWLPQDEDENIQSDLNVLHETFRANLIFSTDDGKNLYNTPGILIEREGFEPFWYFIQGLDSTLDAGKYVLSYSTATGDLEQYGVEVMSREFVGETIELDSNLTGIRTNNSTRRVNETKLLAELLRIHNPRSRFIVNASDRIHPVETVFYTSYFGDRRIYQYSDGRKSEGIHNGLDYRAALGEKVLVPFDGRVVMSQDRIITGNTIVLEHLPAVYSLYFHLDTMAVSVGNIVRTGDLLGTAGDSGLSTASHLHWEIRVNAVAVDPEIFLEGILLDKSRLIDILSF